MTTAIANFAMNGANVAVNGLKAVVDGGKLLASAGAWGRHVVSAAGGYYIATGLNEQCSQAMSAVEACKTYFGCTFRGIQAAGFCPAASAMSLVTAKEGVEAVYPGIAGRVWDAAKWAFGYK